MESALYDQIQAINLNGEEYNSLQIKVWTETS